MIGKNNLKKQYERQAEKVETYSIKKIQSGSGECSYWSRFILWCGSCRG